MINVNELNTKTIRKLSHKDLLDDAKEKRNYDAIKWLVEVSNKTTTKEVNGKMVKRKVPVASYVYEYLTTFCGYERRNTKYNGSAQKERRIEKRRKLFADARAKRKGK